MADGHRNVSIAGCDCLSALHSNPHLVNRPARVTALLFVRHAQFGLRCKQLAQISVGFKLNGPRRFNQTVNNSAGFRTPHTGAEQIILAFMTTLAKTQLSAPDDYARLVGPQAVFAEVEHEP